jgi:hypothetical protein
MPDFQTQKQQSSSRKSTGTVRDERAQNQPADKKAAQQAGVRKQRDSVKNSPENPGEPAGGE